MTNTIGDNIKKYRLERKLTQKKLGEACGIPDSSIRRYESGKVEPKTEMLFKIASKLGVDVQDLNPDLKTTNTRLEVKVPYTEKLSEFSRSDRIFIDMMVESIKKELPDLFDDDDEINKKITENLNNLLNSVNGRVDSLDDAKKFFENELASKLMHYFNLSAPKDKVEIVNFAKYTALKSNNHKED